MNQIIYWIGYARLTGEIVIDGPMIDEDIAKARRNSLDNGLREPRIFELKTNDHREAYNKIKKEY